MPIHVVCQKCKAAFQVSDKFAGKSGPCPKCKAIITVPKAEEKIVIHAPEVEGPKDTTGKPVFTPILREEMKLSQTTLGAMIAGCVTVLVAALAMRLVPGGPPTLFLVLGAIGVAPPLNAAGYEFLRDQELQPYRGSDLWIRVIISGLIYSALWAAFRWMPAWFGIEGPPYEVFSLMLIVPAMIGVGALTAYVAYDVEFGTAALHYGLYLSVTTILSLLSGSTLLYPAK